MIQATQEASSAPSMAMVEAISRQLGYERPPVTVSPAEAAQILGSTTGTLEVWRSTGRYGIPFIKVGSRVRYPLSGLADFLIERTQEVA